MNSKKWKAGVVALAIGSTILFGAESCEDEPAQPSSQEQGQKDTEQAFEQQSKAVPYPVSDLKDSLERRNLRERLLRQNDPERIGYVYILSFGKFLGYYTIKGKVSSTQSQMTTQELVSYACDDHLTGCQAQTLSAPGDDGSYGPNEDGVFFFTTEGAMVQVSTEYIYSDQPLAVNNVPELNSD